MKKVLLCILFSLPPSIHAEPAAQQNEEACETSSRPQDTRVVSVDPSHPASVRIHITEGKLHSLKFPDRILRVTNGLEGIEPDVTPRYVTLKKGEKPVTGNFIAHLSAGYDIPVDVQEVDTPEKAPAYYVVLPPDEAKKYRAALAAQQREQTRRCEQERTVKRARRTQRKSPPSKQRFAANVHKRQQKALEKAHTDGFNEGHTQGLERGRKEGYDQGHKEGYDQGHQDGHEKGQQVGWTQATHDMLFHRAQELLSQPGSYAPALLKRVGRIDPLSYRFRHGEWLGTFFLFVLDVKADRPLPVNPPTVIDPDGITISTTVVYPSRDNQSFITLPNRWNSLVIAVNVPADQTLKGTQLSFSTLGEPSRTIVAQVPRYRLVPETEQQEKLRIWGDQTIITPRAVGGAFWLTNGLDILAGRELKAAAFGGGGARITLGFSDSVGLEAEVLGGRTARVKFGAVERRGTFARLQFGGVVRFGYKVRPFARVGLAFLATSYDSSGAMSDELDTFETTLLANMTLGVHRRISDKFIAGGSVSLFTPTSGEELRTIEVGVHIGFGWIPKKPEDE